MLPPLSNSPLKEMSEVNTFQYAQEYEVESGETLPGFTLTYHTYGKLNEAKTNVIWICHALTANSDAENWWPGLIGKGMLFDPEKYFIICANILGSCYGSTGPLSMNVVTGAPFYHKFPFITVRDMVDTMDMLCKHIGIKEIYVAMGGSLGGKQIVEWSIMNPGLIQNLVLVASNAKSSPWGIAFRESQRMAIAADETWKDSRPESGMEGMKVARSIALLSYRNYETYLKTQSEENNEKVDDFDASSYQQYQGEKLANRSFNAYSYWTLSKAMDSHNVARGRGNMKKALSRIKARVLTIGIGSDILFPVAESKFIAENVKDGRCKEIDSLYGHDGFLIEVPKITLIVNRFLSEQNAA